MVAPTAPSPPFTPSPPSPPLLPPLSPPDHTLLLRLLTLNEDYPALAAELTTESAPNRAIEVPALRDFDAPRNASSPSSPLDTSPPRNLDTFPSNLLSLISWSTLPHIAAWLSRYHTLQDQHSRRLAISELESLLKTSDNPVEKRRTATTLLRALDHKWPVFRPTSPRYKWGEVSGGSATDGEGGCSPSRKPPTTATPAPKSEISNFQLPSPPPRPSASSASTPPASPPHPSISPTPSTTPTDLAKAIATDLSTGDIVQVAATLAAISTDSLRQDPDTVINHLEPFLHLPASTPISAPAFHKPTPPHRHACRITISSSARTLTLTFARLHNQPWLLTHLDST